MAKNPTGVKNGLDIHPYKAKTEDPKYALKDGRIRVGF